MELSREFETWIRSGKYKLEIYNSDHASSVKVVPCTWGITIDDNTSNDDSIGEVVTKSPYVCAIGACLLGEEVEKGYWWLWPQYVATKFNIHLMDVEMFICGFDWNYNRENADPEWFNNPYWVFGQEMRKEYGF